MVLEYSGQIVSIIGASYFVPISLLIEKLVELPKLSKNQVQVSSMENGHSASIILLLVSMFESYVMRVRYINRQNVPIERGQVVPFIQNLYPDYDKIVELTEVFVVRDVIAHNHLWEIDYSIGEDPSMSINAAKKEPSAGDRKYRGSVKPETMETTYLRLNVNPIKISRLDAYKVFEIIWETLLFFEKKNKNQCYVSILPVRFKDKNRVFGDLRTEIKNSL